MTTRGRYQPIRDRDGRVIEPVAEYVRRMRTTILPHWPEEILSEWLHRHADNHDDYAFLGFEAFVFAPETWPLQQLPGREAFADPHFYDSFSSTFADRAGAPEDWLARFMAQEGTWNTPIVLLSNDVGQHRFP